jgi:protein-S-isoprenylcysteine O-methyltransferase Ste14
MRSDHGVGVRARDLAARAVVGILFVLLSANLLGEFQRTGHVTGLLLLVSEALVVLLTIIRRPAQFIDRSPVAACVTALSVAGPELLRADNLAAIAPDVLTATMSATGLVLVVAAKLTLGRSFGLIPANRGVVVEGPYKAMRHPIYAGYLITHAAFLLAYPTLWNVSIVLVADLALVVRAFLEERVLTRDPRYRRYCAEVNWHLVPGLF